MLVRRFLATVWLSAVAVPTALVAGCSVVPARWSDPKPAATQPGGEGRVGDAGDTADQPPPARSNSLEPSSHTLYFLEGRLPQRAADGTTASLAGALVMRGQCHDGELRVVVTNGVAGSRETPVSCDGRPHERALGRVKVGDTLSVELRGDSGTDFAVELAAA